MTSQGGGYAEEPGDRTPPFPRPPEPPPWQPYPQPPVDPRAPVDYPDYPAPQPPQPPHYGYPPPPAPPYGYGPPPPYPNPYDPYQAYPPQTNSLAIASLVVSVAGIFLGIPMAVFLVGLVIPVLAVVLGIVALGQIKRTRQEGRGLAIAGIVIGSVTTAGLLFIMAILALTTAAMSSSMVHWL